MGLFGNIFSRNAVDPASTDRLPGDGDADNTINEVVENVTLGQLLDALQGTGDDWLSFYSPTFYGRNSAIDYIALTRATTLIAQVASYLISNGYYRICDDEGTTVKDGKAKALRKVFAYTFAGRWCSATTIQDAMIDYLIEGNFLFHAKKNGRGEVQSLHRLIPWSAHIQHQTSQGDMYQAAMADVYDATYKHFFSRDIIHGRWPQLRRVYGAAGDRQFFARPPVSLMRPAISAGRALDNYIRKFASSAPQQTLGINFKEELKKLLSKEQREQIKDKAAEAQRKELGNIVFQDWSAQDLTRKVDDKLLAQREFQRSEVAAFYGVPAPLMGVNVTQWGQGIAELGRLAKNYSFMLHIQNFLDPFAHKLLTPGCHIEIDYYKLLQADPAGVKALLDAVGGHSHRQPIATVAEQRKIAGLPEEYEGELPEWSPPVPAGGGDEPSPDDKGDDKGDDDDKKGPSEDEMRRVRQQLLDED